MQDLEPHLPFGTLGVDRELFEHARILSETRAAEGLQRIRVWIVSCLREEGATRALETVHNDSTKTSLRRLQKCYKLLLSVAYFRRLLMSFPLKL